MFFLKILMLNHILHIMEETNSKLTYFLIGGGIGAVLALIFAPRTGQETRKIISEKNLQHLQNLHETSAFFGEVDEVINDNYKLKDKETISIIPPIGGG